MKFCYESESGPIFSGNYIPHTEIFINYNETYILDSLREINSNGGSGAIIRENIGDISLVKDEKGDYRWWMNIEGEKIKLYDFPNKKNGILKIVSYNIEFAQDIEKALHILNEGELKDADVLLLQEMDEAGTKKIAERLNMSFVYYPAINHPGIKKNVGNAILSTWPIIASRKLKLPHPSIYPKPFELKIYEFQKLATIATILCFNRRVEFYSAHAAAFNTTKKRNDIAVKIKNDAVSNKNRNFVIGGDFNSMGIADIKATTDPFTNAGLEWATKNVGQTIGEVRWFLSFLPSTAFISDHIFTFGFETLDAGKIEEYKVSDHGPVWVKIKFAEEN